MFPTTYQAAAHKNTICPCFHYCCRQGIASLELGKCMNNHMHMPPHLFIFNYFPKFLSILWNMKHDGRLHEIANMKRYKLQLTMYLQPYKHIQQYSALQGILESKHAQQGDHMPSHSCICCPSKTNPDIIVVLLECCIWFVHDSTPKKLLHQMAYHDKAKEQLHQRHVHRLLDLSTWTLSSSQMLLICFKGVVVSAAAAGFPPLPSSSSSLPSFASLLRIVQREWSLVTTTIIVDIHADVC